jgi:glutamine amidotransferase
MGWNEVVSSGDGLFDGVEDGARFYFANSYVCHPRENVGIAETTYGEMFVSAVRKSRLCGVQFHPEKSGVPGLRVLSNFVRLAEDSG